MMKSVQIHKQLAIVRMAERQKGTETDGIYREPIANGLTSAPTEIDFPHLAPSCTRFRAKNLCPRSPGTRLSYLLPFTAWCSLTSGDASQPSLGKSHLESEARHARRLLVAVGN